jgi:hypothetical protein
MPRTLTARFRCGICKSAPQTLGKGEAPSVRTAGGFARNGGTWADPSVRDYVMRVLGSVQDRLPEREDTRIRKGVSAPPLAIRARPGRALFIWHSDKSGFRLQQSDGTTDAEWGMYSLSFSWSSSGESPKLNHRLLPQSRCNPPEWLESCSSRAVLESGNHRFSECAKVLLLRWRRLREDFGPAPRLDISKSLGPCQFWSAPFSVRHSAPR